MGANGICLSVLWSCVGRTALAPCKGGISCTTHMTKLDRDLDMTGQHVSWGTYKAKGLCAGTKYSVWL